MAERTVGPAMLPISQRAAALALVLGATGCPKKDGQTELTTTDFGRVLVDKSARTCEVASLPRISEDAFTDGQFREFAKLANVGVVAVAASDAKVSVVPACNFDFRYAELGKKTSRGQAFVAGKLPLSFGQVSKECRDATHMLIAFGLRRSTSRPGERFGGGFMLPLPCPPTDKAAPGCAGRGMDADARRRLAAKLMPESRSKTEAVRVRPDDTPEGLYQRGQEAFDRRSYVRAAAWWRAALAQTKESEPTQQTRLGVVLNAMVAHEEAYARDGLVVHLIDAAILLNEYLGEFYRAYGHKADPGSDLTLAERGLSAKLAEAARNAKVEDEQVKRFGAAAKAHALDPSNPGLDRILVETAFEAGIGCVFQGQFLDLLMPHAVGHRDKSMNTCGDDLDPLRECFPKIYR